MSQNALNNQTTDSNFTINRTTSGSGSFCIVNHLDGTNTANDAAIITQTKPGGGDSYHLTMVDGTRSLCWGMDVSDNFALKETTFAGGTGSPSFGTTIRKLTIAGEQTLPLQPVFYSLLSAPVANVTGNGAVYTLIPDSINFQVGSGYNNVTGVFTAPVTGHYYIYGAVQFNGINVAHTEGYLLISPTGTGVGGYVIAGNPTNFQQVTFNDLVWSGSNIVRLAAGDTCRLQIRVGPGGGPMTISVQNAFFNGCLLF